ncbi:T9SS type A sorting domain-containing protein [Polaribacter litorisediminis]|uniref:reprolysin-like metallopeptidase n=1 Tax=Polaribacter litorisediminis TaxID=1908341 RepID=UPI001CBADBEB|nr:zinc-dependent metalloprotease family protein [Polaribacter litorisediminis]UAM98351.1 T9SS type A sorting domain-containing protein [Polaribacter litorisediminis]
MKFKSSLLITLIIFLSISNTLKAQDFWKKIDKQNYKHQKEIYQKKNFPAAFEILSMDIDAFSKNLKRKSAEQKEIIELPNSDGSLSKFSIKETSNFEATLQAKFPNITSYSAQGIDDPTAVAKISMGTDGFHAVIFSGVKETVFIDPYSKDHKDFIVYKRASLSKGNEDFKCLVEASAKKDFTVSDFNKNTNDANLRTYRLALAGTGEYSQFHLSRQNVSDLETDAVKKAAVLSAMNTSMTRVNGIFERDVAVRFIIVGNNDQLIFLDPDTDNLSNNNTDALINETQSICDDIIGTLNYDIGHTFSTGAGGLAGLGVVCLANQKGRGVTGIGSPVGDPYDVDYVSHEIGHQFGANHTFNNSCSNNRNSSTAIEPGSGSTIMAYAGICPPNVQSSGDDYFHSVSITEMLHIIESSGDCAVLSDTNNTAPIANAGLDFSIPKSTPFVLKGTAIDAEGVESLTYNWEQIDSESGTMPPESGSGEGPMFRSVPSQNVPYRYMPNLSTVLENSTASTWEVLPSEARELNFSFLVRDNHSRGGGTSRDDMKVEVVDAPPFIVTSQNTEETFNAGQTISVTWSKGITDIAPIDCKNVHIKLSVDGGLTFPIFLKANTPNDESEEVLIPNNATADARIMVEAADNIFYNVNTSKFSIVSSTPTFLMVDKTGEQAVCNDESQSSSYTINFDFINGFEEVVTLSATANPEGSTVTFNPATISANGDVIVTVSNLDGKEAKNYDINIIGTAATVTQNVDVTLNLKSATFNPVNLLFPANGATNVSLDEILRWDEDENPSSYEVEIASDTSFNTIFSSGNVERNSYSLTNLVPDTQYFWRVKPINDCGEGAYSDIFSFTTESCTACVSFGNTDFETSTTLVQFNTINNISAKPDEFGERSGYSDYTAINTTVKLNESHALTVNLNTDGDWRVQVKVWIDWNQNCSFDDAGEEYDLGFAQNTENGATDLSGLVITVPAGAILGNTIMRVSSRYTGDYFITYPTSCEQDFDGEVEEYTIIVEDATASIDDVAFDGFNVFPNPTKGDFTLTLQVVDTDKVSVQLYDVRGRLIDEKKYYNTFVNFSENIFFEKASKGLYLLKVTNGTKQTTRKLMIK